MALPGTTRGRRVVALTGQRIDAADSSTSQFPPVRIDAVVAMIRKLFLALKAEALVCSAACGADLLALNVASKLELERHQIEAHVILPFDRERFRQTSVADRPGDWSRLFDGLVDTAQQRGRLHVFDFAGSNHEAYLRTAAEILDEAVRLSRRTQDGQEAGIPGPVTAVAVWDGEPKRPDDITTFFIAEARQRGVAVHEIPTITDR